MPKRSWLDGEIGEGEGKTVLEVGVGGRLAMPATTGQGGTDHHSSNPLWSIHISMVDLGRDLDHSLDSQFLR